MSKFPIIKIVLFYCGGILLQELFNFPITILVTASILVFLFTLILLFIPNLVNQKFIQVSLIYLVSVLLGSISLYIQGFEKAEYPFDVPKINNVQILGKVKEIDLIKKNKVSLTLNLERVNSQELSEFYNTEFICNFYKDTTNSVKKFYDEIKIGNSIQFTGTIVKARDERNPGEFNYENYLNNKGIAGLINIYKIEDLQIVDSEKNITKNIIFEIRKSIDERIKKLYPEKFAYFIKGILLADRSDIDYETKNSFTNTGVIHVLAVSGLHVGFIGIILFLLLGRFNIRLKYILTIFGILLFLVINNGQPSIFRASTMAVLFLIAKLTGRSTNGFNSIAIAGFIILILNPNELFNPGFLLSFSAVLSILILYPIFAKTINKYQLNSIIKKILLFMSVSFAAQIGTLPFTVFYFNKLSLIALFANLFVIPVLGIILAIAILSLAASVASMFIGLIIAEANIFLISALYYFINRLSELSFSFIPIYSFSIVDGIIFYLSFGVILIIISNVQSTFKVVSAVILILFCSAFAFKLDKNTLLPEGELSVLTIDVGQGDSFLVKFPDNKIALIDAGNSTEYFDNGERVIYPLLQRLGIEKIDYAFISHLDSDHYGGIIYLINEGLVNRLYKPKNISVKDDVFEKYLIENHTKYFYYSDTTFTIGGADLFFLNDTTVLNNLNFDSNNNSGIVKITYGKTSFLFTGDAEYEMEEYLLDNHSDLLKSDVLKVGHHGSKSSTSDEFLDAVDPKIGIISAGVMNKFKHPSKPVINKLKKNKIEIRRTDWEGAIILASDGNSIKNIDWRNK